MSKYLLVLFLFANSILFGQNMEHGIYKGQKTQLFICYLTISDTTIEVEYFNEKGGHIFGHFPAKKLVIAYDSVATKAIFKSTDGKVLVYKKKNCYLIKNKEFGNMKVYKTYETRKEIELLRARHDEFRKTH